MDRFATLKLDYPPIAAEVNILAGRFPAVDKKTIGIVVTVANKIRHDATIGADLSLRATQEACAMLGHPLFSDEMKPVDAIREILATAYCGRFPGRIEDEASEAGQIWSLVIRSLNELRA